MYILEDFVKSNISKNINFFLASLAARSWNTRRKQGAAEQEDQQRDCEMHDTFKFQFYAP